MRKYSFFNYNKRIYVKACMNAGFSTVMLGIEQLTHEFLHFRIFFIRIDHCSPKKMLIRINLQDVSLKEIIQ